MLALVLRVVGTFEQGYPTMVPFGGLTAITIVTLWLTRRRLIRPWLLWFFATLDVMLLSHCLIMLAAMNGRSLQLALDTPVALLIFVFLAASAVRHRPFLILYTGGLFIAVWAVLFLFPSYGGDRVWVPGRLTTDIAQLAAIGLTSYALFIAVTRARWATTRAITESHLRDNLSRYFSPQLVD